MTSRAAAGAAAKPAAAASPMAKAGDPKRDSASPAGSGGPVAAKVELGRRFSIYPHRPIPDLSTPTVPAFAGEDGFSNGDPCVAMICGADLPPRLEVAGALRGLGRVGILRLLDFGPVVWPGAVGLRLAIVFEMPEGGRVLPSVTATRPPMDPASVVAAFLQPAVTALGEMFQRNLTHRAIRPDNLYFLDRARTRLVLGPCASAPPGFDQPPQFETIEGAMADPEGRGTGTRADDMFAVGMTMLTLLMGRVPGANLHPDQLLERRIRSGTIDALVDTRSLPPAISECLYGLINDSPGERWTLEQLKLWLDGKRQQSLRGSAPAARSRVPFRLGQRELWTARDLAQALAKESEAASKELRAGTVHEWVRRDLGDQRAADALDQAVPVNNVGIGRRAIESLHIARASIALDPAAPIRYQGLSVHQDGLGTALALALQKPGGAQIFGELFRSKLPALWLAAQTILGKRALALSVASERLGRWIEDSNLGQGIERCLYELNPNLPCRSPLAARYWVGEPADILPALEVAAKEGHADSNPIDRHIAAFLAARVQADSDRLLALLTPTHLDSHAAIGMLKLLARLQERYGPTALPGIAGWCAKLIRPAIEAFHYRALRAQLLSDLDRVSRQGNLPQLLDLADNPQLRQQDQDGFRGARAEYATAEHEIVDGVTRAEARTTSARRSGHEFAALFAAVVASLVTFAVLWMKAL
ncbi:MAG: hypothetical protein HY057_12990 [Rhodospirillales bacterium]|nr:hypothetical protein [Rhodospirillales bacterium]